MSVLKIKDQNGNWIQIPTIKGEDGQDYVLTESDKQEIADLVDTPVEDVQVNGTSVVSNGVANISISEPEPEGMVVKTTLVSGNQYTIDSTYDTIKTTLSFGINVIVMAQDVPQPYVGNVQMDGVWYLAFGVSTTYNNYATLVGFLIPETYQNIAVWVDQSVHIPTLDDSDIDANVVWSSNKIIDELSQKVSDIQVNGTSIVTSGVAVIPNAANGVAGIARGATGYGTANISSNGTTVIGIYPASQDAIKQGSESYVPIVPVHQHYSVFYGLAKAAGDTTQSASNNAVGSYTDDAKTAIKQMLDIKEPNPQMIHQVFTVEEETKTLNFHFGKKLKKIWIGITQNSVYDVTASMYFRLISADNTRLVSFWTPRVTNTSNTKYYVRCWAEVNDFGIVDMFCTNTSTDNGGYVPLSSHPGIFVIDKNLFEGIELQLNSASAATKWAVGTEFEIYALLQDGETAD